MKKEYTIVQPEDIYSSLSQTVKCSYNQTVNNSTFHVQIPRCRTCLVLFLLQHRLKSDNQFGLTVTNYNMAFHDLCIVFEVDVCRNSVYVQCASVCMLCVRVCVCVCVCACSTHVLKFSPWNYHKYNGTVYKEHH